MPQEILIAPLSDEVQEIISNKPNWITRNGILLLLLIMVAMAGVCYFIRYPDVVLTNAKLTSINAPKPIVTTTGGKLIKLLVTESQAVKANDAIGYMESNTNHNTVLALAASLDTLSGALTSNQTEQLEHTFDAYFSAGSLGELQQPYQVFNQALLTFKGYLSNGFYIRKKKMLATAKRIANRRCNAKRKNICRQ
jgi:multidrug efflux pump subunit AcrA (membrane-fusion protein)